jgi:hypothetical protein
MSTAAERTMQASMSTASLVGEQSLPPGGTVSVFMKGKGDVAVHRC